MARERGVGPPGGRDGEGRANPANVEKVVTTPPITNTRQPSSPRRQSGTDRRLVSEIAQRWELAR